jgi:protein CpxP
MKRLILMMLFAIGLVFSATAQKMPTPDEVAKKNIEELDKRLKLTPTQKSIIYNFAYDLAKEQLILFKKQQAGNFKEDDETKFFKLTLDFNKNTKAVLKPDQTQEFEKLIAERLSGEDSTKKKKKKKGEEEEKVVGIEGLKTPVNN